MYLISKIYKAENWRSTWNTQIYIDSDVFFMYFSKKLLDYGEREKKIY